MIMFISATEILGSGEKRKVSINLNKVDYFWEGNSHLSNTQVEFTNGSNIKLDESLKSINDTIKEITLFGYVMD